MSLFFIGLSSIRSKEDLLFYIKCLLIVVFVAFIYGFGQKYWEWPIITTQNQEYSKGIALRYMPGGHIVSTFAGHYDMATFLLMTMPMFLSLFFVKAKELGDFINKKQAFIFRILVGLGFLSGFWLLVSAASRISIASYFVSTVLVLIVIRKFKFIPVLLIVSLIFISLSSNLMDRYTRIFEVYIQKIVFVSPALAQEDPSLAAKVRSTPTPQPAPVFEDRSTSIRLNVEWPRAIRAFTKNPLLGTGFSSITLATDNDYLRLLGEVGILGAISFCIIILRIFMFYMKKIFNLKGLTLQKAFILSIAASIPGILLNAMFIDVFEASKFAIMLWLLVGFSYSGIYRKLYE